MWNQSAEGSYVKNNSIYSINDEPHGNFMASYNAGYYNGYRAWKINQYVDGNQSGVL